METIDLSTERMKREVSPLCKRTLPDGSTWFKFCADYDFAHSEQGVP